MTKSITAVLFWLRTRKDGDKAVLNSCTGWVRHRGRFRESRFYEFMFESELSNGTAEVLLLDRQKQEILRLNRQCPSGQVELDGKSRYYLRWEFRSASGKCGLRW